MAASMPRWKQAGIALGIVGSWAYGLTLAVNYQRATSPLVRNVLFSLRVSPDVKELLGDNVTNGYWFNGTINNFKGRANLDFTLIGSRGTGKIHLEALRRDLEWEFVKLELHREGQETVDLKTYESVTSGTGTVGI